MSVPDKYYVKRVDVWGGGGWRYYVIDREARREVTVGTKYRRTAERQCKRFNDDHRRFLARRAS